MGYQKLTPIIATGSSAPRYLGDRFADVVNLKDFGAQGDGETDDSSAWAAWQTALQSGGMPYIPAGNYLLDDTVVHVPNGKIGGAGIVETYEDDGPVFDNNNVEIWVDSDNGSDSNTGFDGGNAVETIKNAVTIALRAGSPQAKIYVKGQTVFDEGTIVLQTSKTKIDIVLQNNVTINGEFVLYGAYASISSKTGENYGLTLNGCICLFHRAFFQVACTATISYNASTSSIVRSAPIIIQQNSCCLLEKDCEVNATNSSSAVVVSDSTFEINANLTINVSGITSLCVSIVGSTMYIAGTLKTTGSLTKTSIYSEKSFIHGNKIQINTSNSDTSSIVHVAFGSVLNVQTLIISGNNHDLTYLLWVESVSALIVVSALTIYGGATSSILHVTMNSVFLAPSGCTISGDCVGKRYYADRGGQINVASRGANAIPGTTAGSVHDNSYGFYQ